jgi:DNA polymerase-3 subunit epsilon
MFVAVSILTTGLRLGQDRILDLALVSFSEHGIGEVVFSRLQVGYLSPEMQQATGLHPSDLAEAPAFFQIAKQILTLTAGKVLIAEEPRKVYSFLKREFKELGFTWQAQFVSFDRWATKQAPEDPQTGFRNWVERLHLPQPVLTDSLGLANALAKVGTSLIKTTAATIKAKTRKPLDGLLPAGISSAQINSLPTTPGIYYFRDRRGRLLYVGKSKNLRSRVRTHFQIDLQSSKAVAFKSSIAKIEYAETGSELLALLIESEEIKRFSPPYNWALRRRHQPYAVVAMPDANGYLNLKIVAADEASPDSIAVTTKFGGKNLLYAMAEEHMLCQKLCGLYKTKAGCFGYTVKKCNGACLGRESTESYNARVGEAFRRYLTPIEQCLIIGPGRTEGEVSAVLIENKHLFGYGFVPERISADLAQIKKYLPPKPENRDIQTILRGFFSKEQQGYSIYTSWPTFAAA